MNEDIYSTSNDAGLEQLNSKRFILVAEILEAHMFLLTNKVFRDQEIVQRMLIQVPFPFPSSF